MYAFVQFNSVQLLSRVGLFVTPWTAAHQASLSITNSQSLLRLMFIKLVMPSNHLILCRSLLLIPSIFPSIISQCGYKEPTYGLLTETFFSLLYERFCKESCDTWCNILCFKQKQVGWILLCESLSLSIWFH